VRQPPLCRTHHRLKTAGLIHVRAMNPDEEPGIVPGTLEFTTSTGLRYRRSPTPATPPVADLDDPLIATAVAHAHVRAAQEAVDAARADARNAMHARNQAIRAKNQPPLSASIGNPDDSEFDGEDRAWRCSRADRARRRILKGAGPAIAVRDGPEEPPF
jgi:hypothetical protein